MTVLVALLAVLGQLPAPHLAEPGETVVVSSGSGVLDAPAGTVRLEGGVSVESGGVRLFAGSLDYDIDGRTGRAADGLLLVDGNVVIRAREGTFGLSGERALALEAAELWQKVQGVEGALLQLRDPSAARRTGRNALILEAEHLERAARNRFLARSLRMTACDCGEGVTPDWSIRAWKADVEPGERAILWLPALYAKSVPILVLPALYVPLSGRRTGFLFPRPGYSSQNGFFLDEPFFWAISESWDLTLTPGYRFGLAPRLQRNADGTEVYGRRGIEGARASAELRWAPVEGTSGRLEVTVVNDRHAEPAPPAPVAAMRAPRGWRGDLVFQHATETGSGAAVRADVKLVGDANYLADEAVDFILDAPPYLRSQAWAGWGGRWASAALATGWYQDRAAAFSTPERWYFGADAPAGFQRPLSLVLSVPRTSLLGPLRAGLEASAARIQPLALFGGDRAAGWLSLTRIDASPSLSLPASLGPVATELFARGRGDLGSYSGAPGGVRDAVGGRAVFGAWAGTEVSRTFAGGSLKHAIEPRAEVRLGTRRFGDQATFPADLTVPVDEFDQRAEAFAQGIAMISTRLVRRQGGELARLELGQDVDLARGAAADSFGRLELAPGPVSLGVGGRWDWERGALGLLSASARGIDARGDVLELRFDRLLEGGTDRMRAAIDGLFGRSPVSLGEAGAFNQVGALLSLVIVPGVSARYGATLIPDRPGSFAEKVLQHTGGLSLSSACDCWRVDLAGTYVRGAGFNLGFVVDLASLGSFGR